MPDIPAWFLSAGIRKIRNISKYFKWQMEGWEAEKELPPAAQKMGARQA
jgi:hypothetical protein